MSGVYEDFFSLYQFLSPSDLTPSTNSKVSAAETIMKSFLGPPAGFSSAEVAKKTLGDHAAAAADDKTADDIHIISTIGTFKLKKDAADATAAADDKYWDAPIANNNSKEPIKVTNLSKISKMLEAGVPVTAVVSRNPYFTPGTRSTREVELFLNYTPTIMASRLIPFLDVEFELLRGNVDAAARSTPSTLRFLLGTNDPSQYALTDADKAMLNVRNDIRGSTVAYSGMEMFLAPQTLTNMDNLGDTTARLMPVKPFLPFMSIEEFQVTVNNAGAGAMVHKSGNLKLKIHDKSRMSEIAEFIRGSVGFRQAVIWTTYGWLAPRTVNDTAANDEYAKFINEKMSSTECWQTKNAQFSFDAAGQVTLSIEVVSKGMHKLQGAAMNMLPGSVRKKYDELQRIIEEITRIKEEIQYDSGTEAVNAEIRSSQVLNSGATGEFPKFDNFDRELSKLSISLYDNGSLSNIELGTLREKLTILYGPKGANQTKTFKEEISAETDVSIKGLFKDMASLPDPFLPVDGKPDYFNPEIVKAIKSFTDTSIAVQVTKNKNKSFDDIAPTEKVMSFGKLLLNTFIPAIVAQDTADEIQVIFYALNDQCGPIRGHSIAEFPIDVRRLEYAYKDYIDKHVSAGGSITVEEFFRIIISTQFSDNRAIGYGMSDLYEVFNPDNNEAKARDEKQFDSKMKDWLGLHGALKQPIIEMYVETSSATNGNDIFEKLKKSQKDIYDQTFIKNFRGKIIKRIHIYDKQNNPYKLLAQILKGKGDYSIASLNETKISQIIHTAAAAAGGVSVTAEQIKDKIAVTTKTDRESAEVYKRRRDVALDALDVVDRPGGAVINIKQDRKSVMNAVARTAPNIILGANGSMISQASLASKTDGLSGAINIINSNKSNKSSGIVGTKNGLESPNGLPLRTVPAQLTMTSKGCPIASLFQQYYIDFGTGTTIDNLYNCSQLQHSIGPGKFDTSWTFIFTDGYGKFAGAPTISSGLTKHIDSFVSARNAPKKAVIAPVPPAPKK